MKTSTEWLAQACDDYVRFLPKSAQAPTAAAAGFTIANNAGFDCYMFCSPNGANITWRIVNLLTGAEATGVATLTLPRNTIFGMPGVMGSNAALTAATATQVGVNRIYCESDY